MQTELRNDNRYIVIFAVGWCNGSARIFVARICASEVGLEYLLNAVSTVHHELTQSAQANACRVL
jgi:hypothetical protein